MRMAPRGLLAVATVAILTLGILLVAPVASMGSVGASPATSHSLAPSTASTETQAVVQAAASPHPTPGAAPPSSGRGTFFVNNLIPTGPSGNSSCAYSSTCLNNTGNPSITSTPSGVMAVAYTAFTNVTACPGEGAFTYTEIGLSISTNAGSTFGAPQYLDNPTCSEPANYTSAIYPALTSLANGTLVLAYLQYNFSYSFTCNYGQEFYFPALAPCDTPYDQLVVTDSYTNGSTWTTPVVINSSSNTQLNATSWMPWQPAIAAYGDTVYLAWVNWTDPSWWNYYNPGSPSTGLNLVTSYTGGATWGAPVQLPAESAPLPYGGNATAVNAPALAINASGTLYVAYDTNFNVQFNYFCQTYFCGYLYPESTFDVVVATSSNNGSTFSLATAASQVPMQWNGGFTWIYGYGGTQISPEPAIAIDPNSGEAYVAFTGGAIGNLCYLPGSCFVDEDFTNLWIANSTNGGTSWSSPVAIGTNQIDLNGSTSGEYLYTPSVGVGTNGTVYVDVAFTNFSDPNPYYMYPNTDLLFVGTDNGSVWGSPLQPWASVSWYYDPLWDGFDTSMTMYQGAPYFAWTWEVCPGNGAGLSCYSLSNNFTYSQVIVSSLFEGAGVTVSFTESGLPTGATWTVSLGGNARSGLAGTTLSVSGVPANSSQFWTVPWVNTSAWGVLFASGTVSNAGSFSANTTVPVTFSEYVELQLFTIPPQVSTYYPWSCAQATTFADFCANQNVTPSPGVDWEPVNATVAYGVSTIPFPAYCYSCYNLSFLAWTGSGSGSWNTTVPNGTSILHGPVNETASFLFIGSCSTGSPCFNVTYPYVFQETGLPANTSWGVTVGNESEINPNATHLLGGGFGPVNFTVWTVPYNATYSYVPTTSATSPVAAPQATDIRVTYNLVPDSGVSFPVEITETGVPASATGWGLWLGSTELGVPLAGTTLHLQGGADGIQLNASDVYGNAGVGGYLTGFSVTTYAVNSTVNFTSYHLAPGASLTLDGPAVVTAQFASEYWVAVPPPQNGTVDATSQWVHGGTSVTMTATANPGYYFVGWSGTGAGSKSSSSNEITVTPSGPVTEVATFAPILPVYTLTVDASGLPYGTPVTVYLGGQGYTGAAPLTIVGIVPGSYSLSVPTVAPNSTVGTEYTVTTISSTLGYSGGQLNVIANGSVSVTYGVQYLLTVNPSVNGSVQVSPSGPWYSPTTSVMLTATPASSAYVFTGWNGTGMGSSNSTSATIMVSLGGPVSETANFAPYIPPPARTYTLTLMATGLPGSVSWSASIGGQVASGPGNLVLSGLNGTVNVTLATVTPSAGTEYVPAAAYLVVSVLNNTSRSIAFSTMYEVSVTASAGGSATPGSEWVASGAQVALTATPASGYQFVGWNGTGASAYTGSTASTTITVSGPVSEVANFQPIPSSTSSSSSPSVVIPIVALVALLVVGLVVGLVIARSRGPRAPRPPPQEYVGPTETAAAGGTAPAAAPAASPEWSEGSEAEGEEHIYGGGTG